MDNYIFYTIIINLYIVNEINGYNLIIEHIIIHY